MTTPPSKWRHRAGVAASAAVAVGVAAGVGVRKRMEILEPDTGEDEVLQATTDDGWTLELSHYAARGPRRPWPVVLGHGFAGSRLIWDLTPETSFARHLAANGFDVYTVDLRGRGHSWPASLNPARRVTLSWSFDDFVVHDLPTAVRTACEHAEAGGALWIGLEMSGQAFYAAAISGTTDLLRGGITLGAPVLTPPSAKVPGVTSAPLMRRNGRVLFRAGSHYAGPILAYLRSAQLESSFRPGLVDPLVPARYLWNGIPDESTRIADQFRDWVDHATMRSLDHETVWSDRLDEFDLPVLVGAAARDLQRPADAALATFEALGSTDKTWFLGGTEGGLSVDFGHDDLVAAIASPDEVFPRLTEWLDDHQPGGGRSTQETVA